MNPFHISGMMPPANYSNYFSKLLFYYPARSRIWNRSIDTPNGVRCDPPDYDGPASAQYKSVLEPRKLGRERIFPANYRLFTTDQKEDAYFEKFGHSGDGKIPLNTYELLFRFDGRTLNFEKVADSDFRSLFYKTGNTQDENHAFSLCVDYYLECNKFISGYETYGWLSRSGDAAGVTG